MVLTRPGATPDDGTRPAEEGRVAGEAGDPARGGHLHSEGGRSEPGRLLFPAVAGATITGLVAGMSGAAGIAEALWAATTVAVLGSLLAGTAAKLRRGQVGVDVVAVLALAGSLALRELLAGAVIAVMVASGDALERFAHRRARRDLSALLSLAPTVAHRVDGDRLVTIAVGDVQVGDRLVVRPGEVVPVDGVVVGEAGTVDESVLTGEPWPVGHQPGEALQSGSVTAGGPIRLRAAATAEGSAYAGIVRLVEAAGADRAPFVRLADRYALFFVPLTLAVAGLAWLTGGPLRALAVVVVATPCPLVLAAPIAVISGIAQVARHGVVVKDGAALEALASATAVLFDKTGTLTAGRPRVTAVVTAPGGDPNEIVRMAASLEQVSPHVLAAAVVTEAAGRGLPFTQPAGVEEIPGSGVRGAIDGHPVLLGSLDYVAGGDPPPWVRQVARRASREGSSVVFVAIDGIPAGAILLADEIRTDTPRALRALRRAGVERLVMVTGDHAAVADAIGSALGLDAIYADRSPAEKVEVIRAESATDGLTVMVGDGVNDAPALAAADLGVAMGARGATASSEAADVVLVVDRIDRLAVGIRLAKRSRAIARQSVVVGMGLAFAAMSVAAFGYLPPVAGALLQEVIDVAAITNALRVLRRPAWDRPPEPVPEAWRRQLHSDHADLRRGLDELRSIADQLDGLAPAGVGARLRHGADLLARDILPHERLDEAEVYPAVAQRLGGDDPLAAMSRTHREVFHLAASFQRLVDDIGDSQPTAADTSEARRILHALDAILRLHFAQEEELFAVLEPEHLGHATAGRSAC